MPTQKISDAEEKFFSAIQKGERNRKNSNASPDPKRGEMPALMRRGTIHNVNIDVQMFISEKRGKITNDYDILTVLGKGGYGEVKKVIHKITGDVRAMKIIRKESCDESYLKSLGNEINIWRQLDHPNVNKLNEIYQDSNHIYMITEFLGGGELFDVLVKKRCLSESISAKIIK